MDYIAPHILALDDDADIRKVLRDYLSAQDYRVSVVARGKEMLSVLGSEPVDLLLLDLRLPGENGLELARRVREISQVPILILSGQSDEADRVMGLELAADDYVTKPFSPRELILRVNRSLRRGKEKTPAVEKLTLGGIVLDHARHEVMVKGEPVDLTATEFKLLALLMDRRGRVQGRDRLLNDVWGYESVIDTRTVDTHVRRLREKLGDVASYIETVRGVGYRISETVPV
jgi:two-component system phosphate regulon response regulator PhoB